MYSQKIKMHDPLISTIEMQIKNRRGNTRTGFKFAYLGVNTTSNKL